ncbi:MAG: hypothetical protein PHF84_08355 [bacterium]|nr:hypothetical protein [bacterium]
MISPFKKIKLYCIALSMAVLLALHCGKQEGKISITGNGRTNEPSSSTGNSQLTPELFFKISIEMNYIAKKYRDDAASSTDAASGNMEKEIKAVYKKYGLTEDQLNLYSENNYRELESFLNQHSEIENQLRAQ